MAELRVIIDTEDGKKTMVPYTKIDNFNKYADLKQVIKNRYTKNIGPLRQNIVLNYNKEKSGNKHVRKRDQQAAHVRNNITP